VTVFDLDILEFEFPCPRCGFYNPVTFRQVRFRDVTICCGCKRNVQLDDYMNEYRLARRRINSALNALRDSLKSQTIAMRL
jgi:hypothetical protein